jgi:hypothetical protein
MAELGVPLTREPEFHQVRLFSFDYSMVSKQYEEKERNIIKENKGISRSNFLIVDSAK